MKPILSATLLLLAASLLGCPKAHCQSGSKHGTKCYDHDGGYQTNPSDERSPGAEPQEQRPATAPRWK